MQASGAGAGAGAGATEKAQKSTPKKAVKKAPKRKVAKAKRVKRKEVASAGNNGQRTVRRVRT
ncbi:peptidase S11, partial [Acinetobacter baumannii]|nr:peptidase S11 [Acinetobacter baumannii]